MAAGRFVASKLRSVVKAEWGPSDARLLGFGIIPLRRQRKGQAVKKPNGSERPS